MSFILFCYFSLNPLPPEVKELKKMVYVQVFDQECSKVQPLQNRRKRSLQQGQNPNADLQVDLEVSDSISSFGSSGFTMKCMLFYNNVWTFDYCTTKNITTSGDTATVHCDCSIDGYMAVALVDADEEVVWLEEIVVYKQEIKFKIEADYDTYINDDNLVTFRESITNQIASVLQCDPVNVRELKVFKGSIIVEFLLVGYTETEADNLKQSYEELAVLLEAGQLNLVSQS